MPDPRKPCPFCGSNAVFTPAERKPDADNGNQHDWERGRVECVMCDARTGGVLARDVAEAAWDRRDAAAIVNAADQTVAQPIPFAEIEAFVIETRDLVEKVTFDESGRMVAGKWVGGNGGLLSRETLASADTLRRRLDTVATLIASHQKQEGQ